MLYRDVWNHGTMVPHDIHRVGVVEGWYLDRVDADHRLCSGHRISPGCGARETSCRVHDPCYLDSDRAAAGRATADSEDRTCRPVADRARAPAGLRAAAVAAQPAMGDHVRRGRCERTARPSAHARDELRRGGARAISPPAPGGGGGERSRFLIGGCGALLPAVQVEYFTGQAPAGMSDAQVSAQMAQHTRSELVTRLGSGVDTAGFWFGRRDDRSSDTWSSAVTGPRSNRSRWYPAQPARW